MAERNAESEPLPKTVKTKIGSFTAEITAQKRAARVKTEKMVLPVKKNNDDKKSNITAWIWITALLLVMTLLITSVLTAIILYRQEVGTDVIISLSPDRKEEGKYKTFYKPAEVHSGADVETDGKAWEADTEINLFKSSYLNDGGEATVSAANGDKVIAPGTTNAFKFALKNTGNVVLKYTVGIKGLSGLTDKNLPVFVRMRRGADYVIGTESEWVKMTEVKDVVYSSEIKVGKADVYETEWQWPFDGNDDIDTVFGNLKIDVESDFNMTITTVAEEILGAAAEDEEGNLLYRMIMNPALFILLIIIGLLVITLCVLVAARVRRERKRTEDEISSGDK